jgi:hypothetical protein
MVRPLYHSKSYEALTVGTFFWDCKLYKDQRATVMEILSENSKKEEYPKSVTELLRIEEKRFVQGFCYFIKFINLFKKGEKEINVQNINSTLLELS